MGESETSIESGSVVTEFDVRPGAIYELRFVLVDPEKTALSACRCLGRFRQGENLLSDIVDFPVEVFSSSVANALESHFFEGSRFFRAPALASRVQFSLDSSVAVRYFTSTRLTLTPREIPSTARALNRTQKSRRAMIKARLHLSETVADLLDYPARQFANVVELREPYAAWSDECCASPAFRQEIDDFHARLIEPHDSKPTIAFIGSERLFLHLSGVCWPVVPRAAEPLTFSDAMPAALIIEETIDDIHSEWMQELFPPDGVFGNCGQALLDYAQEAEIPVRWLRQSANTDSSQPWHGRTVNPTISGDYPLADLRLLAPFASSHTAHERVLFPCASDLFQFTDLRTALAGFDASNLLVTEAQYGVLVKPLTRDLIQIKNAALIQCTSYLHLCRLYRNAGIVLLFENTLRTRKMQSALVADAVGSGCVVVYVGDASVLGQTAELVWPAEDAVRAGEIIAALRDIVRHEQTWLKYYRRLARKYTVEQSLTTWLDIDMRHPHDARASVITVSKRPHLFEQIVQNFSRQRYENKELILIFNCPRFDLPQYKSDNVSVYFVAGSYNIGYCLNFGRRKMTGDFWFKMDDDDIYGRHYLEDMLNAFHWSGADAVGKPQSAAYLEGSDCLVLRRQSETLFRRWMTKDNLCGATLSGRASSLLPWFSQRYRNANDSQWVASAGATHKLLFSDILNYLTHRSADDEHHSWRISDDFLIHRASRVFRHMSDRLGTRASAKRMIDEWS